MLTFYLSKYLSGMGYDVHVAVTVREKNSPWKEKKEGFTLYRIDTLPFKGTRTIQKCFKLYKLAHRINPDIIQGHAISCGMFATLIGKLLKKPSITYIQGYDLYHANVIQKLTEVKIALKYADIVLAASKDLKERSISLIGRPDIVVIPPGLESEENINFKITKEKYGFKSQDKIILYVGRLIQRKGLIYLIKAIKIVYDAVRNIHLIIIGQGEEEMKLRGIVKRYNLTNRVHFLGAKSHKDVLIYMSLADIFVLPSIEEAFGIVLLEAMSQGLPIVASNVQGIPYVIKNGVNGFLVPPKNGVALAERIEYLLKNPDVAKEIGERNRRDSLKYRWDRLIIQYVNIYSQIKNGESFGYVPDMKLRR